MKYIIITPVKNEENYIEHAIKSVIFQKIKPVQWIILNDNSNDNTEKIIRQYIEQYKWINLINISKLKITEISARIAYLVNYGVSKVKQSKFELIMKLDADVSFGPDFCKNIINEFKNDQHLGIASGNLIYKGKKTKIRDEGLTRGAAKFYRKKIWEQIGGVYLSRGWDTIDNYAAQYYGWNTKKLNYFFEHHKEEGKKSALIKKHYWTGLYNGRVPYNLLFFSLKLIYHFFDKPILLGILIQLYGYIKARYIKRERPFPKEISNYVRKQQVEKMKLLIK